MSAARTARKLAARARLARACTSGAAAVEFALVLPLMLLLLLGGFELSQTYARDKRVSSVTRTLADLTTQYSTMSEADVITVLNSSAQVMSPYSSTGMSETISEILIDSKGKATVVWSRALNATPLAAGAVVAIPIPMQATPGYFIWVQTAYPYTPVFQYLPTGLITLKDQIYMGPRNSYQVLIS